MEKETKKMSNRLTVMLDKKMQISFLSGINQVYKNSHLVNEFVVRPTFSLLPTETMWVTFQNAEENPTVTLKAAMLAERKTIVTNSTEQVVDVDNDVSQILQTPDTGCEYYLVLPDAVLMNDGTWYFSLAICENTDSSDADKFETVSTSSIGSFTVFNSLAGAGTGGSTPTDLDVASLYNVALQSVADAEKFADEAKDAAGDVVAANYAPYIGENGNWFEFSKQTMDYVDSGIHAQGNEGQNGAAGIGISGATIASVYEENDYTVSKIKFYRTDGEQPLYADVKAKNGAKGEQGPQGVPGPRGKQGSGIYVSSQAFGTGVERYDMSSVSYVQDELTAGDLVISAQNYNVVYVRSITSDGFNFIGEYKFNIKGPEGPAADLTDYATKTYVNDAITSAVTTALNTPV